MFIVVEGIDGSGTSTQSRLLYDYFVQNGEQAHLTSEPSEGAIGKMIRKVLRKEMVFTDNENDLDRQLAFLYAADRFDHLYNQEDAITKKVKQGHHVVCTRYVLSSLAYNGKTKEDTGIIKDLNRSFPDPDILIYIVHPVESSMERIAKREVIETYENQNRLEQVSCAYLQALGDYQGKVIYVDGTKSIEEIHSDIVNKITNLRNEEK